MINNPVIHQVFIALLTCLSLLLAGCETVQSTMGQFGVSDPYLKDKSDTCYDRRVALSENGTPFFQDLVAGAISGAAVGAVGAAVTGGDVGKAAMVGALAGLAGGYLLSLQR